MRWGTLLTGAVIGAGAFIYFKDKADEVERTRETRRRRAEDQRAHDELEHMVDDVVHRPDIPETPVKQAFEHALGEHEHPAGR